MILNKVADNGDVTITLDSAEFLWLSHTINSATKRKRKGFERVLEKFGDQLEDREKREGFLEIIEDMNLKAKRIVRQVKDLREGLKWYYGRVAVLSDSIPEVVTQDGDIVIGIENLPNAKALEVLLWEHYERKNLLFLGKIDRFRGAWRSLKTIEQVEE